MLGTWLEIVQIDSVEQIGAMMHQDRCLLVDQLDVLAEVMLLIVSTR